MTLPAKVKYAFKMYIQNGLGADMMRVAKYILLCEQQGIDFYMTKSDKWEIVPELETDSNWHAIFSSLRLTDDEIASIGPPPAKFNKELIGNTFENFTDLSRIVRDIFKPKPMYDAKTDLQLPPEYAVIHIRRGDKVTTPWREGVRHELDEYYERIKEKFRSDEVVVMTDSPDVAREAQKKGFIVDDTEVRRDGFVYKNHLSAYSNEAKIDEIRTAIKNLKMMKNASALVGSNASFFFVVGQCLNGKRGISLSENLYYTA